MKRIITTIIIAFITVIYSNAQCTTSDFINACESMVERYEPSKEDPNTILYMSKPQHLNDSTFIGLTIGVDKTLNCIDATHEYIVIITTKNNDIINNTNLILESEDGMKCHRTRFVCNVDNKENNMRVNVFRATMKIVNDAETTTYIWGDNEFKFNNLPTMIDEAMKYLKSQKVNIF